MAAHAIRAEVSSRSRALATQHVRIGSADRVLCRLFASLIIPFIGHAAIVADIDIPPGGKGAVRLIPAKAGPQSRQRTAGQVLISLGSGLHSVRNIPSRYIPYRRIGAQKLSVISVA